MSKTYLKRKCTFCKEQVIMPFHCKYCGEDFCVNHRLPEQHKCPGLLDEKKIKKYENKIYKKQETFMTLGDTHEHENNDVFSYQNKVFRSTKSKNSPDSDIRALVIFLLVIIGILSVIFIKFTFIPPQDPPFIPPQDPPFIPPQDSTPIVNPLRLSSIEGEISDDKGNIFYFNKSTPSEANLTPGPDSVWGYLDINSEIIKIKMKGGMTEIPLPHSMVEVYWDSHYTKNQSWILGHEKKYTDSKGEVVFSKSESIRNEQFRSTLEVTQIYFHIEPAFSVLTTEIYIYNKGYNVSCH